jgi:hypothetical protein
MKMLQDIHLLEQTLEDRYLEIVVKAPQAEEDMFEERLFGDIKVNLGSRRDAVPRKSRQF